MTLFELRQAIESSMPWWVPFAFGGVAIVVFVFVELKRK